MPFPKGISPKVNVLLRLQFELAYYDAIMRHVNHNITWITYRSFVI